MNLKDELSELKPEIRSDPLISNLVKETLIVDTTPLTTPIENLIEPKDHKKLNQKRRHVVMTINKLATNCAKNVTEIDQLENEIELCHNFSVGTCEEFEIIFQCLVDVQHQKCHLFDMPSFETALHAYLIERYADSSFSTQCLAYKNLQGNIFHTSVRLCSLNYINEQRIKKQECSTVEEHNMMLQIRFQARYISQYVNLSRSQYYNSVL